MLLPRPARQVYNMISVRGDAVVIEYDRPRMDAALANDPRKYQVPKPVLLLEGPSCAC